jgi:copper chaperone CopZ
MHIIGLVLGVLVLVGGSTQTPAPDKSADLKVCMLKISGMACEICAARVEKEAKKIDGVKTATVDQPKGTAQVTYDPAKTTPARIAKVIQDKTSFKTEVQPSDPPKK